MSPFIQLGDDIFVKHEAPDSLSLGDVVVVIRENDIVTHRLIKISLDTYICKGDNTHIPDPPVKGEQIFGRVTAIQRAGERISMEDENWIVRNKVMGRLGNLENQIFKIGWRFKEPYNKNPERNNHISVGRIIFSPFRAIMRLIAK